MQSSKVYQTPEVCLKTSMSISGFKAILIFWGGGGNRHPILDIHFTIQYCKVTWANRTFYEDNTTKDNDPSIWRHQHNILGPFMFPLIHKSQ